MRHGKAKRKLGREKGQRKALLKSLAFALTRDGKIKTTEAKAKELRPYIEKLVTRARKNSVPSRRLMLARLNNNDKLVKKMFEVIGPRYMERAGGYTRVTKLPSRAGDAAKIALIEFV